MQRQKFYNLRRKPCFYCVLFVFKKKQNSARPTFVVAKKTFFFEYEISLLLIDLMYHIIYLLKKKNKIYHKMQREKLYYLGNKAYLNSVLFVFKNRKIL